MVGCIILDVEKVFPIYNSQAIGNFGEITFHSLWILERSSVLIFENGGFIIECNSY